MNDENKRQTQIGIESAELMSSEEIGEYFKAFRNRELEVDTAFVNEMWEGDGFTIAILLESADGAKKAELLIEVAKNRMQSTTATIEHYEDETLVEVERLSFIEGEIDNEVVASKYTSKGPNKIPCSLCCTVYSVAQNIIKSGVRTKNNLRFAYLNSKSMAKIQKNHQNVPSTMCQTCTQYVLQYVTNNGVSKMPVVACKTIGACP